MNKYLTLATGAAIFVGIPLSAQKSAEEAKTYPAPSEIVAAAKAEEWVAIAPSDLLVMDLAAVPDGKVLKPRRVVIQLMPPPFSQGWIGNIRKLAAAKFWDGTSINRVQDNYVTQWGDASEKKALPAGLAVVPESEYVSDSDSFSRIGARLGPVGRAKTADEAANEAIAAAAKPKSDGTSSDSYTLFTGNVNGWPLASDGAGVWPTHCYGMVGVGRNLSPDSGTGAELYTVIGHAPRHLDRNIALVGRVIEGIEYLSSLPRGTGALGFYEKEEERVPILSVRLGNDAKNMPAFEYLSTESASFAAYADARANRRDPFFIRPAGGADICNIPVPVRRKSVQ
ncbi:MAG: peptidylprolyl isomerase [Sphingorhabdus sp.]